MRYRSAVTPTRLPFDGRVPPPDFVNIETTKYCNLRCEMCHQFQDGTVITGPHLEMDRFNAWADATLPFAHRMQPSVTGEPLMSKGLPRMLEKVAEYGVRLDIVTNATLLNARMRAQLLPVLGRITISFDAAHERAFETVRAGAKFETVVANVRALCDEVRALPPAERPIVLLACVLMRCNIDELPDLVDLAADLGVHGLALSHMHPPTEDMKRESLVHDVPRAVRALDHAFERAERRGLPVTAQPLDQLIAASASSTGGRRQIADLDGAIESLGARSVNTDRIPAWPTACVGGEAVSERRAAARAKARFAAFETATTPPDQAATTALPDSIWVCDFLWNKTYVTITGDVRTCCVPGTPVIGNIERESFEQIWDDRVYAAMRARIACKDPAPICRGCQHISEVRDPNEIARLLGGRPLPSVDDIGDLPVVLDPRRLAGVPTSEASDAPVLHWEEARSALGYEVELSLDQFKTIAFATSWHGDLVETNAYVVPDWAWDMAPYDEPVYWRSVAWLPELKIEVGLGAVVRRKTAK